MKNYILALMLIPLLLHGQKFRDSEVKFIKDERGKRASKAAVMQSVPRPPFLSRISDSWKCWSR
ncbi:MAG: hypothetical protein CM1200mP10_16490 [Candidatus Neomarinimicrobiota bacterium]|nr:MAG: hypothetical protein CM1200mP10_16490 [Candidatus Neomarinimicrobiota bacterium]